MITRCFVLQWEKRAASISTRGSLSSGLGTATESDIYPFESRTTFLPVSESINENLPMYCNEISSNEKAATPRIFENNKSINAMKVVRESGKRQFKQFFPEKLKKKPLRKSNASSSSASCGAKSSDDLPPAELLSSTPNSGPTSVTQSEKQCCSVRSSDSQTHGEDEIKLEMNEICSNKKIAAKPAATEYGEKTSQLEIVSPYFDLYFPPKSLISKQLANDENVNKFIVEEEEKIDL